MTGPTDNRVLIAGAGLGGLAAALALRQVGYDALVLELAPRLLPFGSGLQIWPHGVQGLRQIGVVDEVLARSGIVKATEFRTPKGRRLVRVNVETIGPGTREPVICVSRVDLHNVLADAVGEDGIRVSTGVVGFEQDDRGVTVKLADGSEERGAVLVGADGRESKLRELLAGPVEHRYVGQGWGTITPVDSPGMEVGDSWVIFGRGARFGIVHMAPGKLAWNSLLTIPREAALGGKAEALASFEGWAPPVGAVLEATPEEHFFGRAIMDFVPIHKWGEGRVTLLGDAAHATTPAQGRGVSEAIEDAIVLANRLVEAGDLSDPARTSAALRAYEDVRREPTAEVTNGSWRIMGLGSLRNPVAIAARNSFFRVAGKLVSKKMYADLTHEIEPLAAGAERPAAPAAERG